MAISRLFSHKAFQASLQLLTGEQKLLDEPPPRDFRTVQEGDDDKRRVSMVYYTVPKGWCHGGGISFDDGEDFSAMRDRLLIWKSSKMFRHEVWRGNEDMPFASCIELHLVAL
jgi:hypothetical protein